MIRLAEKTLHSHNTGNAVRAILAAVIDFIVSVLFKTTCDSNESEDRDLLSCADKLELSCSGLVLRGRVNWSVSNAEPHL